MPHLSVRRLLLCGPAQPSSSSKLGDTEALADRTHDRQVRRVFQRRRRKDESQKEEVTTDEQQTTTTGGDPEKDNDRQMKHDQLLHGDKRIGDAGTTDEAGLPSITLSSISLGVSADKKVGPGAIHHGKITITARVHHSRSMSTKLAFVILRQQTDTIQGVLEINEGGLTEKFVLWVEHLPIETLVRAEGRLRKAPERIHTCSIHDKELVISGMTVLSSVDKPLPVSVYDMDKVESDEKTGENHLLAANRIRIANRIVFLRTPVAQSVMRIRSSICRIFRSTLEEDGFLEIQTPKLQPAATESGAEVFRVNYFGRTAFLAQSPQLSKQMAVSSDLGRVFEVGPVFRAENSNTHRHLTEFTGLDLEMALSGSGDSDKGGYYEAMDVIDHLLKTIFNGIYSQCRRELDEIRQRYPHKDLMWLEVTPRLTFKEGIRLLNESGWVDDSGEPAKEDEDLATKAEIRLGQLVKDKYKTDYYILDKFPASARPFYTRLDQDDGSVTNSFDIFIRGQEITTGGERINEADVLAERMKAANIDPQSMEEYMDAFHSGAPPHAGCGIGLERLLYLLLGLDDIRDASMFPRDPKSLAAPSQAEEDDVPFPEADTIRFAFGREEDGQGGSEGSASVSAPVELPELGKLIANYGDATNTSWLDETYTVWRHRPTGAAVGYAESKGYKLIMGNPLCDERQMPQVISAFLESLMSDTADDRLGLVHTPRVVWLLVSAEVKQLLGSLLGWQTLSVVAEQRLHVDNAKPMAKKERQAKKAALRIDQTGLGELPPEDVRDKCDKRIEEWKQGRKGTPQAHITEIRPWIEPSHRQYLWATDPEGTVQGLVVLHRLAKRHGYQVKFALDFPGAPSGSIEALISEAMRTLQASGATDMTFGAGATEEIEFGNSLDHTVRARIIRRTYRAVMEQLRLAAKSEFREKFGAEMDRVYVCYPKRGLGISGARAIINFFERAM